MAGSDEDHGRSRRPGAEDQGWSSTGQVLGGQTIERSGDTVCDLHRAQGDEEHGFLGLASKPRSTVSSGLALKPVATSFRCGPQNRNYSLVIWASKSQRRFLFWSSKTSGLQFVNCATKPMEVEDGVGHLASRLAEAQCRWCTWRHHGGRIEMKLKTDGLMQ
jgi:hypothetical protein